MPHIRLNLAVESGTWYIVLFAAGHERLFESVVGVGVGDDVVEVRVLVLLAGEVVLAAVVMAAVGLLSFSGLVLDL